MFSPNVREMTRADDYLVYHITLDSHDLRSYFDEPDDEKCSQLLELLLDEMLDPASLDECIRRKLDEID